MRYWNSLRAEWLKTKGSSASWLCLIGGLFIPIIRMIAFLVKDESISQYKGRMWEVFFNQNFLVMAQFLLPMGVILAAGMITQLEFKNNAWKQVNASPQSYFTTFSAKFIVILLMTLKFFLFFTIGIVVVGTLSTLIKDGVFPESTIPFDFILEVNWKFFVACLPILGMQYLLSLLFKNFLVPVGIGLLGIIGSLIGMTWEYVHFIPYSYTLMSANGTPPGVEIDLYWWAFGIFSILLTSAYFLFISKKEKG